MSSDYRFSGERRTQKFRNVRALQGLGADPMMTLVPFTPLDPRMASVITAALRVGDLWTRDAAWSGDPSTLLRDFRNENCCEGSAGCEALYCLFQMWEIGGACTTETFAKYILQFDRFAKAQDELRLLMNEYNMRGLGGGNAPRLLQRMESTISSSEDARTWAMEIGRNARWWAEWVVKMMSLIAVARWSLNIRWTLVKGRPELWANERAFLNTFYLASGPDPGTIGGLWKMPTGCDCRQVIGHTTECYNCSGSRFVQYPTNRDAETIVEGYRAANDRICSSDNSGAPVHAKGVSWETSPKPMWLLERSNFAIPSLVRLSDNATAFGQTGGDTLFCDVGPKHWLREQPLRSNVRVPVNAADFAPQRDVSVPWSPNWGQAVVKYPTWGRFNVNSPYRTNGGGDVTDMLEAWFDTAARSRGSDSVLRAMGRPIFWSSPILSSTPEPAKGYPSALAQIAFVMSMAQDIVDHSAGAFVEGGMATWMTAYESLPEQYRTVTPAQALSIRRAFTQNDLDQIFAVYSGASGAVVGVVSAIFPIAGIVLGVVLMLVGLLIRFAQEICAVRAASPPCLASPFIRYIPTPETGATERTACDWSTTSAGGAAAIRLSAEITAQAAGRGMGPELIFDALDESDTGITGDGVTPDERSTARATTNALIGIGVASVLGVLVIAAAKKKKRERDGGV